MIYVNFSNFSANFFFSTRLFNTKCLINHCADLGLCANIMNIWEVYRLEMLKKIDKQKMFITVGVGIGLLFFSAIIYCYYLTNHVLDISEKNKELRVELEAITTQKDLLANENEELKEKVLILSDTLNSKIKAEEELAKTFVPTGFPLKGTATYNEETKMLEGQPYAEFVAAQGTVVIATAEGIVSSIAGDDASGYIVMVDHGNGYFSVYRNGSKPKVEVGETVTVETELFDIQNGNETLGYQIINNNAYIDPLSLMEIYG